ncbi:AAC(3) family N-acetyltransferase [Streptomyces sp. NPDC002734]|uniref:aminoglycoside N(3)-acetyltransferase n=1 Tax=Streptomyces sp. NPDC002734 TaxID=3154426 RepID=UPI00331BDABD
MASEPVAGPLVTRPSLAADLRSLGVRAGGTLLVHSSLSSLGWVNGGAVAVVQALLDAVGPEKTLAVPAQSGALSDPAYWENPPIPREWWETVRATMPRYDAATTPAQHMGVIAETVRAWPGAVRSAHPQTSFAALGRRAAEIVEGHAADCALGEHSPLARLERLGARVLLLGVGYDSCTALHLAEYRTPSPVLERRGRPGPDGWEVVTDVALDSDDFDRLGEDLERDRPGLVAHGRAGAARARLFPLADAVAYAEGWLREHRPAADGGHGPAADAVDPVPGDGTGAART